MIEEYEAKDLGYINVVYTINPVGGRKIVEKGMITAHHIGVRGVMVVVSREGLTVGYDVNHGLDNEARPFHEKMARKKVEAVQAMNMSTRKIEEWMGKNHRRPEHFAELIPTTLGGGVVIFADRDLKKPVGAVAFSGGEPEEDEIICIDGIWHAHFYSDISLIESTDLFEAKKNS